MLELKAEPRKILGKKVKKLRKTGYIPAVLYGHNIKSLPLTVEAKEFSKALAAAGETSLLSVSVGGVKHNVLIHEVTYCPLSGAILHIDFYEVRMDEKLKAKIPLVFVGEAPAVKTEGGIFVRNIQEVEIEALPQDLPKEILVDISGLDNFEARIRVKDLIVSGSVKILANAEEIVASVAPPRSEQELAELEAKPVAEVGEIKVVSEEKKEVEEGEVPPSPAGERKTE